MNVLQLRAVNVWYAAGPHVLRDLDLDVGPGEHWALLGPNGAGKSTLLALAGAQRHPSSGTVDVLGERLGHVDLRTLRERIGTVDVRLRMPTDLCVADYVLTGATQTVQPLFERYDEADRERAATLVQVFGLSEVADRSVGVCSQGERSRARVARALMPAPQLLLLDEPAVGLDLPGRSDLLQALERLPRDEPQLTSITVAHHLEELPATTTHVALLRDGRFVATGPAELLHDADALSQCFGRGVRAFAVDGRWYAAAR
ncbi:MAG TPA: ATP-binding cassette domain-containing protein [Mycobacteriales bacterium]|nr:ATP-binding cassette domain-containing protein [Mycobacteriales bacterium]